MDLGATFDEFQSKLMVENIRGASLRSTGWAAGAADLTPRTTKIRLAESRLRDSENYSFVCDVIKWFEIGKAAFYGYPLKPIRTLGRQHA